MDRDADALPSSLHVKQESKLVPSAGNAFPKENGTAGGLIPFTLTHSAGAVSYNPPGLPGRIPRPPVKHSDVFEFTVTDDFPTQPSDLFPKDFRILSRCKSVNVVRAAKAAFDPVEPPPSSVFDQKGALDLVTARVVRQRPHGLHRTRPYGGIHAMPLARKRTITLPGKLGINSAAAAAATAAAAAAAAAVIAPHRFQSPPAPMSSPAPFLPSPSPGASPPQTPSGAFGALVGGQVDLASLGPSPLPGTEDGLELDDDGRGLKPLPCNAMAVKCTELSTGNSQIFMSVRKAAEALGVNASTVSRALQHKVGLGGRSNQTMGFEFTHVSLERAAGEAAGSGEGAAAASASFLAAQLTRVRPPRPRASPYGGSRRRSRGDLDEDDDFEVPVWEPRALRSSTRGAGARKRYTEMADGSDIDEEDEWAEGGRGGVEGGEGGGEGVEPKGEGRVEGQEEEGAEEEELPLGKKVKREKEDFPGGKGKTVKGRGPSRLGDDDDSSVGSWKPTGRDDDFEMD
uniref:RWP-RK domain-containing protein n=1 Tax=Chromera velia CCMP2878 TaxID=1169474 RepID=A0A0G4H1I6_9ALVE|eukprot:Cvel_24274.t1-p1 / transcript=Cvel_24274.t1 / gene=Cvel_24274 / organism=Chromera_velia_CCMP2878 / gene_product=hypothetical protein / transcript_product=hypothetical protein / location=Cvel_scaffold2603:24031-25569(-) / protein_length=513 / sequence_SO=supercontig / SO=protein_coding / is_pseudo=false